jgi:hypothetical protein
MVICPLSVEITRWMGLVGIAPHNQGEGLGRRAVEHIRANTDCAIRPTLGNGEQRHAAVGSIPELHIAFHGILESLRGRVDEAELHHYNGFEKIHIG